MYEQQTFDAILSRMLARVPVDVDKREGSIIYDALSPAAAELAQLYAELDLNNNLSFADTATGDYLSRLTAQFGVHRAEKTRAVRQGMFYAAGAVPIAVPIGSRFASGNLTYVVQEAISTGVYRMVCETAGVVGNQQWGPLLPIFNVPGLAEAVLGDVLVPGEEEETDDALRSRYYERVNEPAFGGNVADYKQKIGDIAGVGAVKITPVWDGGGTVKATVLASDWREPSGSFVDEIQTIIDPVENEGEGYGLAPIGHRVTIVGVQETAIAVDTTVTLTAGVSVGQVQGDIEAAIAAYLLELRQDWADQAQLVVRVAQIDARILTVQGVEDVIDTELNEGTGNVVLAADEIPVLGTVTVHA